MKLFIPSNHLGNVSYLIEESNIADSKRYFQLFFLNYSRFLRIYFVKSSF